MGSCLHRVAALFLVLIAALACSDSSRSSNSSQTDPAAPVELLVAVASSAAPAFEDLGAAFTKRTGIRVQLSPGASGILLRQAEEGAPFDLFVSADMARIVQLQEKNLGLQGAARPYARGEIVLWQPEAGSPGAQDWQSVLAASDARIAIAQPERAPHGRAALECLERTGLLKQVDSRIVYGSNVQQVHQFALTGNAGFAFIPRALLRGAGGHAWEIDKSLYEPFEYGMMILARTRCAAESQLFFEFVLSDDGAAILQDHGFTVHGQSAPHG